MLKVYTTSTCVPCKMVKQLLDSKGAKYETVVLDKEPDRVDEAIAISGSRGVPLVTDGKNFVVGWAPVKLLKLLEGATV